METLGVSGKSGHWIQWGKKLIHLNVKFSVWKSIIVWFSLLLLLLMIMVSNPGWVSWRKCESCVVYSYLQVFPINVSMSVLNCNIITSIHSKKKVWKAMWIIKIIQVKANFKGNCRPTICKHTYCCFCILSKCFWEYKADKTTSVALALSKLCINFLCKVTLHTDNGTRKGSPFV